MVVGMTCVRRRLSVLLSIDGKGRRWKLARLTRYQKGYANSIRKRKEKRAKEVNVVERGNGFYGDDDNTYNDIGFVGQPPR